MKQLLAVLGIVLLPLALSAQTQHLKFTNDGAFASVSTDSDPLSSLRLDVSRGSTKSGSSTNLTFNSITFAPDFSSVSFIVIVGAIPDGSFTGDNTNSLTLDLDVSTLDPTTSFSENCTADLTSGDPIVTCTPLTGSIHLSFSENGFQRNRVLAFEGFSTFGPITMHTHQRSDTGSANVQGSILGTSISSSSATVGTNHMSTLEFTKN